MAEIKDLDPYLPPPKRTQEIWKNYQKCRPSTIDSDPHIIDLQKLNPENLPKSITLAGLMPGKDIWWAFDHFMTGENTLSTGPVRADTPIFTHDSIAG
jgi:hypothetical protein